MGFDDNEEFEDLPPLEVDEDGLIPPLPGGVPSKPAPITGSPRRPPSENDASFRQFFTKRGFGVNRTFGRAINPGSLHPKGLAADVNFSGKSPEDVYKLAADAIQRGYRLFDERVPRAGVKQTGPHLHFERGGRLRASSFLDASQYGGEENLKRLRELDAARRGGRLPAVVPEEQDAPTVAYEPLPPLEPMKIQTGDPAAVGLDPETGWYGSTADVARENEGRARFGIDLLKPRRLSQELHDGAKALLSGVTGVEPSNLLGNEGDIVPPSNQEPALPATVEAGAEQAPAPIQTQPPVGQQPVQQPEAKPQGSIVPGQQAEMAPTTFPREIGKGTDDLDREIGETAVPAELNPEHKLRVAMNSQLSRYGVTPEEIDAYLAGPGQREVAAIAQNPNANKVAVSYRVLSEIKGRDSAVEDIRAEQAQDRVAPNVGVDMRVGRDFIADDAAALKENAGTALAAIAPFTALLPEDQRDWLGANLVGGAARSAAGIARSVGGVARMHGATDVFEAMKDIAASTEGLSKHTADDSFGAELVQIAGGAPGDLSRLYLMTRIPGFFGTVAGFSADSALQSTGKGDAPDEILRQAGKGAILGTVFGAAPLIGGVPIGYAVSGVTKSPLARKAAQEAGTVGAIALGTEQTEKAFGASDEEAFRAAVVNSLFHLGGVAKEALVGKKISAADEAGNKANVTVDPEGSVRALPGEVAKADVNIFIDKRLAGDTGAVVDTQSRSLTGRTAPRGSEPPSPPTEGGIPMPPVPGKRISDPDPAAIDMVLGDESAQKLRDVLQAKGPLTDEQLLKELNGRRKTNVINDAELDGMLDLLYRAGVVEFNENGTTGIVGAGDQAVRRSQTSRYERYDEQGELPESEIPQQAAPVDASQDVPSAKPAAPQPQVAPEIQPQISEQAPPIVGTPIEAVPPTQLQPEPQRSPEAFSESERAALLETVEPLTRARIRRERFYNPQRPVAEIAQEFGVTPEQVEATETLNAIGERGQLSYYVREIILDPAKLNWFDETARVFAESAELPEDASHTDRQDLADAVLDGVARSVGVNRSSQMTLDDWNKVLDTQSDQLPLGLVKEVEAATDEFQRWKTQYDLFLADPALKASIDKVFDELGVATWADLKEIKASSKIRRAIQDIGEGYADKRRTGIYADKRALFTRGSVERAYDRAVFERTEQSPLRRGTDGPGVKAPGNVPAKPAVAGAGRATPQAQPGTQLANAPPITSVARSEFRPSKPPVLRQKPTEMVESPRGRLAAIEAEKAEFQTQAKKAKTADDQQAQREAYKRISELEDEAKKVRQQYAKEVRSARLRGSVESRKNPQPAPTPKKEAKPAPVKKEAAPAEPKKIATMDDLRKVVAKREAAKGGKATATPFRYKGLEGDEATKLFNKDTRERIAKNKAHDKKHGARFAKEAATSTDEQLSHGYADLMRLHEKARAAGRVLSLDPGFYLREQAARAEMQKRGIQIPRARGHGGWPEGDEIFPSQTASAEQPQPKVPVSKKTEAVDTPVEKTAIQRAEEAKAERKVKTVERKEKAAPVEFGPRPVGAEKTKLETVALLNEIASYDKLRSKFAGFTRAEKQAVLDQLNPNATKAEMQRAIDRVVEDEKLSSSVWGEDLQGFVDKVKEKLGVVKRTRVKNTLENVKRWKGRDIRDVASAAKIIDQGNGIGKLNTAANEILQRAGVLAGIQTENAIVMGFYAKPTLAIKLRTGLRELRNQAEDASAAVLLDQLTNSLDKVIAGSSYGDGAFYLELPTWKALERVTIQEEKSHRADFRVRRFQDLPIEGFQGSGEFELGASHLREASYFAATDRELVQELVAKSMRDDAETATGLDFGDLNEIRNIYRQQLLDANIPAEVIAREFVEISNYADEFIGLYEQAVKQRGSGALVSTDWANGRRGQVEAFAGNVSAAEAGQGGDAAGRPDAEGLEPRGDEGAMADDRGLREGSGSDDENVGSLSLAVFEEPKPEELEQKNIIARADDLINRVFPDWLYDQKRDVSGAEAVGNVIRTGFLAGLSVAQTNLVGNQLNLLAEQAAKPLMAVADRLNPKANPALTWKQRLNPRTAAPVRRHIAGISLSDIAEGLFGKTGMLREGVFGRERGLVGAVRYGVAGSKEASRFDLDVPEEAENPNFVRNTGVKPLDWIIELTKRFSIGIDRPTKAFARTAELRGQARVQAKNYRDDMTRRGLQADWKTEMERLRANPTPVMTELAERYADTVTFQNPNMVTDLYDKMKNALLSEKFLKGLSSSLPEKGRAGVLGQAAYIGLSAAFPFVRTPTNIGIRSFEYLPTGIGMAVQRYYSIGKSIHRQHAAEQLINRFKAEDKKLRADHNAQDKAMRQEKSKRLQRYVAERKAMGSKLSNMPKWKASQKAAQERYEKDWQDRMDKIAKRREADTQRRDLERELAKTTQDLLFTEIEMRQFAETAGRAGLGNTIAALFLLGVIAGVIKAVGATDYDEEKDRWYAKRDAGILDNTVEISGRRVPYDSTPLGKALALAVTVLEQYRRPGTAFEKAPAAGWALASQASTFFPFTDGRFKEDSLSSTAGQYVSSATPFINLKAVSEAADVIDPKARTTRGQGFTGQFMQRIPGVRQYLPESGAPLGGEAARGTLADRFGRKVDPFKTFPEQKSQDTLPVTPFPSARPRKPKPRKAG